MTQPNDISRVKHLIREGWDKAAAEYARDRIGIFRHCAVRLLELLDPDPGDLLLDVGCGTGLVGQLAKRWIGPDGAVIGNDISFSMLRHALEQIDQTTQVYPCQMDAQRLGLANACFDAVTCAFSLFQFPEMRQSLNEMNRTLKPGGRIGLSNWGPGYFSPIASIQRDLFRAFGIRPLLTNPIYFKPADVEGMLLEAGFLDVRVVLESREVWFASPEEVWAFNVDMGPFIVMLQHQLAKEKIRELFSEFVTTLEPLKTEQGIKSTFHVLYAIAECGAHG